MAEFIILLVNAVVLYMGLGMTFALLHCFAMMYSINFIDSETSEELTISAILQQTFAWICDWPRVIIELVVHFRDK